MLYDPKWNDRVMLVKFLKFAKEQKGTFKYHDRNNCACGQFFKSIGVANWWSSHQRFNRFATIACSRSRNSERTRWSALVDVLEEQVGKRDPMISDRQAVEAAYNLLTCRRIP